MHVVIIGNGVAGIEAAFAIRDRLGPSEATITVVSEESEYFFSRTALMYALMDRLDRRDLEPYERHLYAERHIDLLRGRVVDLDAERRRLRLDEGDPLAYDRLLLAVGARPRMVPWKGLEAVESGVVHLVSMQDLDRCERLAHTSKQAVVVGGGLIGVELVECLAFHGLEVTFLVREPWFWPAALGREEADIVADHIAAHGVDVRLGEQLDEILVDEHGRVNGVRTDADAQLDCQMLGVAVGVVPNVDWLGEVTTPPKVGRGILVDRSFRTSLPDVWAAGDCVEIALEEGSGLVETYWYAARRHGQLAGLSVVGEPVEYRPPIYFNSTKFFELEFTTVGNVVDAPDGSTTLFRKMPGEPISQRIVANARDEVIGFNLLGSRFDHTVLQEWIATRRSLDWVRQHLNRAQFDVEFGRVPLEKMRETELAS